MRDERFPVPQEEGCLREWGIVTKSFSGKNGKINKVNFARVEWIRTENDGRPRMQELNNSAFSMQIDMVLLAMGFVHAEHNRLLTDLGIQYDQVGNIITGADFMTSVPGVFAAGDSKKGASLVVHAIFQGRQAAEAIDSYLIREE